jgi:hypothetical protein
LAEAAAVKTFAMARLKATLEPPTKRVLTLSAVKRPLSALVSKAWVIVHVSYDDWYDMDKTAMSLGVCCFAANRSFRKESSSAHSAEMLQREHPKDTKN